MSFLLDRCWWNYTNILDMSLPHQSHQLVISVTETHVIAFETRAFASVYQFFVFPISPFQKFLLSRTSSLDVYAHVVMPKDLDSAARVFFSKQGIVYFRRICLIDHLFPR